MANGGKKAYRVVNWAKYNESLVRRGDITLWFDQDVIDAWKHDNAETKVGRPFIYSDVAIETLLTLRELFRLPYRQTEGFGRALANMLNVDVVIPHHTSLQKRAAKLTIATGARKADGPIDVVVDSTGLKVYGEGEWHARKHGASKRRTWRKLHLAVNPDTHEIVAHVLTENDRHDADQVDALLDQTGADVECFHGDGAYDQRKVYNALAERGVDVPASSRSRGANVIIPPRKNAKIWRHRNASSDPLPRDEAVRAIRRIGRKAWKELIGYHRRSLAETAMYRMKRCFGGSLKNRKPPNQQTEVALRCKLLNWFVALGVPAFTWS